MSETNQQNVQQVQQPEVCVQQQATTQQTFTQFQPQVQTSQFRQSRLVGNPVHQFVQGVHPHGAQVVQGPVTTSHVHQSVVPGATTGLHQSYKGESQFEYIPFQREYQDYEQVAKTEYVAVQKQYTDYEPVQKIEQVPVTRQYTDYYTVEHQTEYVPQVNYTTQTEYVPQQKSYIEQVPVTKQVTEYVPETRYTTEYVPQQRAYTENVPVQRQYTEYVAETRYTTEYVAQQKQIENVEYVPVTKQVVHQPTQQAVVPQATTVVPQASTVHVQPHVHAPVTHLAQSFVQPAVHHQPLVQSYVQPQYVHGHHGLVGQSYVQPQFTGMRQSQLPSTGTGHHHNN